MLCSVRSTPDRRVRTEGMAERHCRRRPADGLTAPPEGGIRAGWGVGDVPLDAEKGIRLWEGDRPDGMAYRTFVNPWKDR